MVEEAQQYKKDGDCARMIGIMVNKPIKIRNGQGESKWAVEASKNVLVSPEM